MAKKNSSEKVKIVKVQPYPIECRIFKSEGQVLIPAEIILLEEVGFIFKSASGHYFRVGDEYVCDFEIPVMKNEIHQFIKIIKTKESAESYVPGAATQKIVTVEAHFKEVDLQQRAWIRTFQEKIGQLKKRK